MADPIIVDVNNVCRIPQGVDIKGDITSTSDIRVDGTVTGNIVTSGKLVTGETAVVKGDVKCANMDFSGQLFGNAEADDSVIIKASALIDGDVRARKLQVEMGARLNGALKMVSDL